MPEENVPKSLAADPATPRLGPSEPKRHNAFTVLMSGPDSSLAKRIHKIHEDKPSKKTKFNVRDALYEYIETPESFPPSVVLDHNKTFVVIRDKFPKASLHMLLLPRNRDKTWVHPIKAFDDVHFLEEVCAEAANVMKLAASELRRLHGQYSEQEKIRRDAMAAEPPPDELPEGRDWERELQCGIHAGPSMNNLHIHIMSIDRSGPYVKHRKHYNSFSTAFFIPLKDFPLASDDYRRTSLVSACLHEDLICWRCGKNFGNAFDQLQRHLQSEFEEKSHGIVGIRCATTSLGDHMKLRAEAESKPANAIDTLLALSQHAGVIAQPGLALTIVIAKAQTVTARPMNGASGWIGAYSKTIKLKDSQPKKVERMNYFSTIITPSVNRASTALKVPPSTMDNTDSVAHRRILVLESQVSELSDKTVIMAARLADSQNEILELQAKLQQALQQQNTSSRPETPSRPMDFFARQERTNTHLSPSPPQSQHRNPSPSRFKAFFMSRDQNRPNNGFSSSVSSDSSLQEALSRETQLRKEAESKLNEVTTEIEELTASLFSEANEMVAQERRARAKLEERVAMLEKRDLDKKVRLERLEKAVTRVDRVRSLVGEKRDSAHSMSVFERYCRVASP
ncbi:aprataxin-like protein [Ascosphaera aggregata]|nr:aprataxin-like protein [Ascosphaera aggregata]